MFHRRSTEFDPNIHAIAGHLRAIEKELGALEKRGGRRAAASASVVGNQIADAIGPILGENQRSLPSRSEFGAERRRDSRKPGSQERR